MYDELTVRSYTLVTIFSNTAVTYRIADKSLARPGRKQATSTEDFDFHISYL
jgi:hypothetical protein